MLFNCKQNRYVIVLLDKMVMQQPQIARMAMHMPHPQMATMDITQPQVPEIAMRQAQVPIMNLPEPEMPGRDMLQLQMGGMLPKSDKEEIETGRTRQNICPRKKILKKGDSPRTEDSRDGMILF